jgi:hypothetical protein
MGMNGKSMHVRGVHAFTNAFLKIPLMPTSMMNESRRCARMLRGARKHEDGSMNDGWKHDDGWKHE